MTGSQSLYGTSGFVLCQHVQIGFKAPSGNQLPIILHLVKVERQAGHTTCSRLNATSYAQVLVACWTHLHAAAYILTRHHT